MRRCAGTGPRLLGAALFIAVLGAPAWSETVLLSCPVSAGKALHVTLDGRTVSYRFGPGGNPDLTLERDVLEVRYEPWPGVGRTLFESARIENGGYAYEIWHAVDRLDLDAPREGGVRVLRGAEELADIRCVPDSWEGDLYGLFGAREAAGECWDHAAQSWGMCPTE